MIRTRIAPSPTGFPHIGTIYQVLFDWAYAKRHHGRFFVRIEDTDQARFVEGAEEKIFESLDWFGLTEDESPRKPGENGPYRQSERLDIYKKYAQTLLDQGNAYYCFCTKERLEEVRKKQQAEGRQPMYDKHCRDLKSQNSLRLRSGQANLKAGTYVVRMKVPENRTIIVQDEIRGDIEFDSNTIDDQVILKSDGFPTYHLAVVVDDHLWDITHVVRGEEWLTSLPKHWLLYEFFGWEKPVFVHTPALRNADHSKMSKRHGHTNVTWYQENGFLPEAILNYLALLGWSHPEEKEIFSLEEFVELFDLKDLKPVGPIFDLQKLTWMNGVYLRELKVESLKLKIIEFDPSLAEVPDKMLDQLLEIAKTRMKTLKEFRDLVMPFIHPESFEVNEQGKTIKKELEQTLSTVSDWNIDSLVQTLKDFANGHDIKFKDYYKILLNQTAGLPLADVFVVLGKERTLELTCQ